MHAQRTFWERATAIDVFCLQGKLRGDPFARHWHDVARLDEAGAARQPSPTGVSHWPLPDTRARFAEKVADRSTIDYLAAVSGGLHLVPAGDGLKSLEQDYIRMVEDGLLFEAADPFEALMARCANVTAQTNGAGKGGGELT